MPIAGEHEEIGEGGGWLSVSGSRLTISGVHLAVLPLQLRQVERHAGCRRRVYVEDLVARREAVGRAGAGEDDGRVGDHGRHLPAEPPRRGRQPPRPPPPPRRRHARTHGRRRR